MNFRIPAPVILVIPLLFFSQCGRKDSAASVAFQRSAGKTTSLIIPEHMLGDIPSDSLDALLRVRWEGSDPDLSMLGQFADQGDGIIFTPVVPFTAGLRYEIVFRDSVIARFELPPDALAAAPMIMGVFPSSDTVPENLLKMFIQFSQPMVEGRSLGKVIVLRGDDTVRGTFLDLQPELWNEEGTLLTLWLDPGRIKRDLIPNKQLGNPLVKGSRYSVHILPGWRSKAGLPAPAFSKNFFVTSRDEQSPVPNGWQLLIPKAGTKEAIRVTFAEPLDYSLISSALSLVDGNSAPVAGRIVLLEKEKGISFFPEKSWQKSIYTLRVERRLEDLAGNNLERLFDADMTKSKEANAQDYERKIGIPD